uniref:Uncharacterized protein n=1 Tax=Arundo donax TaxID=35708 RepID=A0A0A8XTH3_ARUDO
MTHRACLFPRPAAALSADARPGKARILPYLRFAHNTLKTNVSAAAHFRDASLTRTVWRDYWLLSVTDAG